MLKKIGVAVFLLIVVNVSLSQINDYEWIITSPSDTFLASGDSTAIMKAVFEDKDVFTQNKLIKFEVRPLTNHSTEWYIESLQLWWDIDGEPGFHPDSDSLIGIPVLSSEFGSVQSQPDNKVRLYLDQMVGINLGPKSTFWVVAKVVNFRELNPDPEEPDIGEGIDGTWFGVTALKSGNDIAVTPGAETYNAYSGNDSVHYVLQAQNLPVTVHNLNPSSEESEHTFFPNFLPVNKDTYPGSDTVRIHDQEFTADIYLPINLVDEGDSLSYASFYVGWDNTVLELDTIYKGDIWDGAGSVITYPDSDRVSVDTIYSNYSVVFFERGILGQPAGITGENNSLARLDFRVLKPGISPIFLRDIEILDQRNIPYHIYQELQNNLSVNYTQYDAWAKFILGDFASGEDLENGEGDAKVDIKDWTLFKNYLWISPDSSVWYDRFDIGAPGFRDPDGNAQYDDTTNFHDILILGMNYYRSQRGLFNQKPIVISDEQLTASLSSPSQFNDLETFKVKLLLSNVRDLLSAQAKIKYDPRNLEFMGISSGDWLNAASPEHLMLLPPAEKQRGVVDINFVSLENPLSGNGDLAVLMFKRIGKGHPAIDFDYFDPRDIDGDKINYTILKNVSDEQVPTKYLLLSNYPNPFNSSTIISYTIPEDKEGDYSIAIYDIRGNIVKNLINNYHTTGKYTTKWDGKNNDNIQVVSGIYFLKFSGSGVAKTTKITLLR